MVLSKTKMSHFGNGLMLRKLYHSPVDPKLERDRKRLSATVSSLVSAQVERSAPPFPLIAQAYGFSCRLRIFLQLWLSLQASGRKDLQAKASKILREIRPERVQLQALMMNRVSLGTDAPPDWVTAMKRRNQTILPWRAAIGRFEQSHHDVDAAWLRCFELEHQLSGVLFQNDSPKKGKVGIQGLRATTSTARQHAAQTYAQRLNDMEGDLSTIFRQAAIRYRKIDFNLAALDIQNTTRDIVLDISRQRGPALSQLWFEQRSKDSDAEGMVWRDRFGPGPFVRPMPLKHAITNTLEALAFMHPAFRKAAQKLIRKGALSQPSGSGGGFTTPVLFDRKGRPDGGPFVFAPFDGALGGARTLVHELAHGAHAYLSRHNGPVLSDSGWAIGETVALTAERVLLGLNDEALSEQDLFYLVHQPALVTFENSLINSKDSDPLDEVWTDSMHRHYGEAVLFDGYGPFWRRHTSIIANPGYPLAYVLGWALAVHATDYLKDLGDEGRDTYLDQVRKGGAIGFEDMADALGASDISRLLHSAYDKAEARLKNRK